MTGLLEVTGRLCVWFTVIVSYLSFSLADESISVLPSVGDYGNPVTTQSLLQGYEFASSWGKPATVNYQPPAQQFNRVVLDMTVNTTGSNYDRLAIVKLDDIEIWRSSTPEPDNEGLSWVALKDVSHYLSAFQKPHTLEVYLNNRQDGSLNGAFQVTLNAQFFNSQDQMNSDDGWAVSFSTPADQIQALSPSGNGGSNNMAWSAPDEDISVQLPALDRSVGRALLHIFASGNGDDEFWWSTNADTNPSAAGPSRFVDVYVGGQIAGFVAPFPVIFTGGVSPYLWRPLVGLRAFDVPGYYVDITPFLPALWGGADISLNVTNGIDESQIPSNWWVNANLLTWSEGNGNSGSSQTPQFTTQAPQSYQKGSAVGISRHIKTSAQLTINGNQRDVEWEQQLQYSNQLQGSEVVQYTSGNDTISGLADESQTLYRAYSYPLQAQMNQGQGYRIQQSYDVLTDQAYSCWIDTRAIVNSQNQLQYSNSSEYTSGPVKAHYAESENQKIVIQW